jgi:predicted aspartyl protease
MFVANWRTAFSCALLAAGISTTAAGECRLTRIASLPFTGKGAIVVPAKIDGAPVPMVVDTGAPASAIDPVIARKLHLVERQVAPDTMYDFEGQPITHTALAHDLALSGAHANDVRFLVWPTPLSTDGSREGTLAADLLQHYDVEIDFAAGRLNLFSQDHCPGKVVYWTSNSVAVVPMHVTWAGHITVPVMLDGQPFDALLDTGATYSVLFQDAAREKFGLKPMPRIPKPAEVEGAAGVPRYFRGFKSLDLEGLSIRNPILEIRERTAPRHGFEQSGGNDLILGLNELRHLHLYIAYGEEKLYITPAAASVAPMNATRPAAATTASAAH